MMKRYYKLGVGVVVIIVLLVIAVRMCTHTNDPIAQREKENNQQTASNAGKSVKRFMTKKTVDLQSASTEKRIQVVKKFYNWAGTYASQHNQALTAVDTEALGMRQGGPTSYYISTSDGDMSVWNQVDAVDYQLQSVYAQKDENDQFSGHVSDMLWLYTNTNGDTGISDENDTDESEATRYSNVDMTKPITMLVLGLNGKVYSATFHQMPTPFGQKPITRSMINRGNTSNTGIWTSEQLKKLNPIEVNHNMTHLLAPQTSIFKSNHTEISEQYQKLIQSQIGQ